MKKLTEALNTPSVYYLLHAATGMTWGVSIVMAYFSMITGFWTINTYIAMIWAVLAQIALSYFYYRHWSWGIRFLFKGIGLSGISAGIIIAGAWMLAFYGI